MMRLTSAWRRTVIVAGAIGALPVTMIAQGTTERTPNLSGEWIGNTGTVYFNLVHRFESSPAPERKVSNSPTFVLATPVTSFALVGTSYATNSTLAMRFPNEHEYFVRVSPLQERMGAPFDIGIHADYNDASRGPDAELGIGRTLGPLKVLGAGRLLRRVDTSGFRSAIAGGALLRLGQYVAISGDAATVTHRASDERVAWGAALQLQLPLTPHTLALQVTNVGAGTLQGSSRGDRDMRYGFEFTIPFTVRRYLPHHTPATHDAMPTTTTPSSTASGPVVQLHIQGLAFRAPSMPIHVGTTVEWKNDDPLAHTVVAADGSFQSPLIEPGQTWRHTFTTPGTFAFSCTPHPFMHGTIIVQ